jgi:hypothetical protein
MAMLQEVKAQRVQFLKEEEEKRGRLRTFIPPLWTELAD